MTDSDLAKREYEARTGFWNGSVYWDGDSKYPVHKGCCSNCGRVMEGWDYCYEEASDGPLLCGKCFDLFSQFTPVMVKHCPGCVEDGNSKEYRIWRGLKDFIARRPSDQGWHYEYSLQEYWDYKKRRDKRQMTLLDVKDDRSEWWVIEIIHNDMIIDQILNDPIRLKKFHAGRRT